MVFGVLRILISVSEGLLCELNVFSRFGGFQFLSACAVSLSFGCVCMTEALAFLTVVVLNPFICFQQNIVTMFLFNFLIFPHADIFVVNVMICMVVFTTSIMFLHCVYFTVKLN